MNSERRPQAMLAGSAVLVLTFLAVLPGAAGEKARPNEGTCAGSPLMAELDRAPAAALLRLYGYDLRDPWTCTPIASDLAPRAQLLRFNKISANDDDHTAFTVVKAAGPQSLWIIPTTSGMLTAPEVENDPHNRAAFNAVLGGMPRPPSSTAEWDSLARFYLAVVGHAEAFLLKPEEGASTGCASGSDCSLSFADRAPQVTGPYWKWTVTFERAAKGGVRLADADAELVSGSR